MGQAAPLHPYIRPPLASHRCRHGIDYRTWLIQRIQAMRPSRLTAPRPPHPISQHAAASPDNNRPPADPEENRPNSLTPNPPSPGPRRPGSSGTPNARRWVPPRSSAWHGTKPVSPSTVRRFNSSGTHSHSRSVLSPRPPRPDLAAPPRCPNENLRPGKKEGMRVCWVEVLCDLINPTRDGGKSVKGVPTRAR